nr:hypothetical protein [Panacagrimonas sp.]
MWLRFWMWTAAMALLIALYALRIAPTLQIQTDLLAMLPVQDARPTAAAEQRYADALSRRLLFLVGAADTVGAVDAATAFAETLRTSGALGNVSLELPAATSQAGLFVEHRHALLADADRRLLQQHATDTVADRALAQAYGLPAQPRALPLTQDPFNFLGAFLAQQADGLGHLRPVHGVLMVERDGMHHVLITAEVVRAPFALDTEDRVVPAIDRAARQARSAGARVLSSGVLLHATEAAHRARGEIVRVGVLSMLGVALMIGLTFRSVRPLLLSAAVLGTGALAAVSTCQLLFGHITLLALVFGSSLIGVAVDYSTHFLADQFRDPAGWTPQQALHHVGPGIAIGMGCAVLGYLSLGLTPLPGLRQMAVFAASGLIVACGSVLCWYPVLAPAARRSTAPPLRWAARLDRGLQRLHGRGARIAAGVIGLVVVLGLVRLDFADDVGLLHTAAPRLVQDDDRIRDLLGSAPDSRFFVVQARTAEDVLQREERLRALLDPLVANGSLEGYRAVSRTLPSELRQREDHALLAATIHTAGGAGPRLMSALGFPPALIATRQAEFERGGMPLLPGLWLADAASAPYRDLWLGEVGPASASIVSLSGIRDPAALQALAARVPGATFVDRVGAISDLLTRYRRLALLLLGAAYVLIGGVMLLRYRPGVALRLLAAPIGAALITLAALGALGALNLFHVLGLFVVLGLGVDYAVFLREGAASRAPTVLAISLSTVGTALSYGLLSFSSSPFIRAIGLTLLLGVALTWVLALLLQPPPPLTRAPSA